MRSAFILGSNGPKNGNPLQYARNDAKKIGTLLSKPYCGFETKIIDPNASASEIRTDLYAMADSCAINDTFLCYFSGHGVLEKGELMLLLDKTDPSKLLGTSLPVADIIRAVSFCQAKSKLVILDCCHAGSVVSMIGLKDGSMMRMDEIGIPNESFLILMASGRLERARELDEISGSFMTENICSAIDDNFEYADKDKDGSISIDDLNKFLYESTSDHNSLYKDKRVPYPELFGRQKGHFQLTLGAISDWKPYEFNWPNKIKMVCLPIGPFESSEEVEYATCISKYPITNEQYAQFVKDTDYQVPLGKNYVKSIKASDKKEEKQIGQWVGGFRPWNDSNFSKLNQPVVCVSYKDTYLFCEWLNRKFTPEERSYGRARVPSKELWDFAAFGTKYPSKDPKNWMRQTAEIIYKSSFPAEIEETGKRTNARGVSDMFGNIWEWCGKTVAYERNRSRISLIEDFTPFISLGFDGKRIDILNIRGGSFLDDLPYIEPFLEGAQVPSGLETVHSDLGFRIGCRVRISTLPENIQYMLRNFKYPKIEF